MNPLLTGSSRYVWTSAVAGVLVLSLAAIAQSANPPAGSGAEATRPVEGVEATAIEDRVDDGERGIPPVLPIADQFSPTAIVNQAPSQVFPDNPGADVLVFDEIRTTRDWLVEDLIVFGVETGDPLCNQAVVGQIWEGRPGAGGFPILNAIGNQIGDDLVINFGGQLLPPGEYLINAHVVRPQGCPGAGEWLALLRENDSEAEAGMWLPNQPVDAGNLTDLLLTDDGPLDMMFQLTGVLFSGVDCDANGEDDFIDLLVGNGIDTNGNGILDRCERDGLGGNLADFDLDGIPDVSDPQPTVYHVEPGAAVTAAFASQLTFPETDMHEAAALTEHGSVTLTFPTSPDIHLYVNMEIDGVWAIQNQVVFTTEVSTEAPTQSETYYIDLGNVRGDPVADVEVRWWVDPIGLDGPPVPGTGDVVPVGEVEYRVGGNPAPPGPKPAVPGTAGGGPAPAPAPEAAEVKTTVENNGIRVADMKYSVQRNSCGPNSVAGSFEWLIKTYKLSVPASVDTLAELLWKFRIAMNTLLGKSTTDVQMKAAKEGFIRKHKLPLVVHSGNVGTANRLDNLSTPQEIFDEIEKGQDVEILFGWWKKDGPGMPPTWKRHGGHFVAIKKVVKCVKAGVTTWKITFVQDKSQSKCGGVECVTAKATSTALDLDNDGTNETGWVLDNAPLGAAGWTPVVESWVAESPTYAHQVKCVKDLVAAWVTARDAANASGDVDLAEAREMLKGLQEVKRQAKRALAVADSALGPGSPSKRYLKRLIKSCCVGIEKLKKHIKSLGGKSASRSVLPEDLIGLLIVEGDSMLFDDLPLIEAALPPDADFDDVEDGLDNAPLDANPDQADQDFNGTPDVLELSPLNDCNDNGVMDVHEVTLEAIVAYDVDGNPIFGFPFDLDTNGIPDDCETAPPVECLTDLDGDFDTDVFDFGIFAANFGSLVSPPGSGGDFDLDGDVDVFDFGIFAADFGCTP